MSLLTLGILLSLNLYMFSTKLEKIQFNFLKYTSIAIFIFYTSPSFLITSFDYNNIWFSYDSNIIPYQNFTIIIFMVVVILVNKSIAFRPSKSMNFQLDYPFVIFFGIFLCIIGTLSKFYLLSYEMYALEDNYNPTRSSRFLQFIRNIDLWGFFILSALAPKWILTKRKYRYIILYFIYLIFIVTFSFYQGRRTGAVLPIIIFLYSFQKIINIKLKYYFLFGSSMILLFISTTIKRLSEAGIEIDLETITIALNAVLSRVFNPFVILNKIIGFGANYDFKSFELFFIGLVPSFLYSNKPILSIGNDVGKKLNLINQGNHNTGINPGWIGEGYYNFDLIGVFPQIF